MTMKRTLQGDVPLAYYEVPGAGIPVVFVHAFPLNHHIWEAQLAAASGRRMLALDLRGFGESGPPTGAVKMADLASDVMAVLAAAGIERAHFAGCSMGGYVLMQLLRQSPQAALSLALIDTRADADTEAGRAGRLAAAAGLRKGGVEARRSFEEGMIGKLLGKSSQEGRPEVVAKVRAMMAQASTAGIAAALEAMASRPDSNEALARFEGPVLVACGEEDALIPAEESHKMVKTLRHGELLEMPGAGHLPSLETPEALTRALQALWPRVG